MFKPLYASNVAFLDYEIVHGSCTHQGSAYCKQQSLVYHQFVYWRRKLVLTEDCLKQKQTVTGFARVVSVPGAGIGGADGLTVSLPGGVSITGLHAGNIELLGAVLRQL
jgi:hypothetical protein